MAHNNIEVEIKIPLSKKDFLRIKKSLRNSSKFIKSSHHIDHYYTPTYSSFLKPKYPFEWLAIRERDGKFLFNYKHWYPEGVKNTEYCDEYETEVGNEKQLKRILKALKFKKLVTVEKKRWLFIYKDELEIALDEVPALGYFIEIESLKNFGGLEKTRRQILKFSRSLSLFKTITIPGGYAAEMMRKKGLMN